jgi:hypothetical protein
MPISQERELEIEQELAAIVRELERRPLMEKRGPKSLNKRFSSPWARSYLTSRPRVAATRSGASEDRPSNFLITTRAEPAPSLAMSAMPIATKLVVTTVCIFSHTGCGLLRAPGFPCALCSSWRKFKHNSGVLGRGIATSWSVVIRRRTTDDQNKTLWHTGYIPPETVIWLAGGWSDGGQDGDVEIFNPDC